MLQLALIIVILVLVMSGFGISLSNLFHAPLTVANFNFLWHLITTGFQLFINALQSLATKIQQFHI